MESRTSKSLARVAVLRPAKASTSLLTGAGFDRHAHGTEHVAGSDIEFVQFPLQQICAPPDPDAVAHARARWVSGYYEWTIFTSARAIDAWLGGNPCAAVDIAAAAQTELLQALLKENMRVAVIGRATGHHLLQWGKNAEVQASLQHQSQEGLLSAFDRVGVSLHEARMLLPRAEDARNLLPDGLRARAATVDVVCVYVTKTNEDALADLITSLQRRELDAVLFTASSQVRVVLSVKGARDLLAQVTLGAIGQATRQTIEDARLKCSILPKEASFEALTEATEQYFLRRSAVSK